MVPPLAMKGRALVAWNLRRIRVKRGLSQERLAFDSGVDRSYVRGLERREHNPTVDLLDRLARTLSYQRHQIVTDAHGRVAIERMRPGSAVSAFQASQQASTISV